jgi:hypothetical protein
MSGTVSGFDFLAFAREIYTERPSAYASKRFLLPALYGGEAVAEYEALFVLEAPSVSFTEARWTPCTSTEDAVRNHRRIFADWACRGKQVYLFQHLFLPSKENFYKRFYITDIWKDSAFNENKRNIEYRRYWMSKLSTELNQVRARNIIFVGREAAVAGRPLIQNRTALIHEIPFPSQWISNEQFKGYVDSLAQRLRGNATTIADNTGPTIQQVRPSETLAVSTMASEQTHSGRASIRYDGAGREFKRLTFRKSIIDLLSMNQTFEVVTSDGIYAFTKGQFYQAFPNIVKSASYSQNGLYHCPPPTPQRARPFLLPGTRR